MNSTLGICSDCGAKFPSDSPRIGAFCEQPVQVEVKEKGVMKTITKKCRGAVVWHESKIEV